MTRPRGDSPPPGGRRPLIGVIGGLGPAATLDFYARVLEHTPAATDQEHIRLLLDADPEVPDRNESVAGTGASSAPALVAKARRLKEAGAELLVMPCNAAHAYRREIEAAVRLPFVSIVDEALKAAIALAPTAVRVGILATTGTLGSGLYQRALTDSGRAAVTLEGDRLAAFMRLIYRVKAADNGADVGQEMVDHGRALVAAGAQALIAACTEVPLALRAAEDARLGVPLIDATEALARAVVRLGSVAPKAG